MYESDTVHGSSPHRTQQPVANTGIFLHLWELHSSRSRTRTVHLGCVYISYTYLGGNVSHRTLGVRLETSSRQFTTPYTAFCSERNLRTPAVRICRGPPSWTRTVHLGCVYTNYTYLGGTVAHFTPGVPIRCRSRYFTTVHSNL